MTAQRDPIFVPKACVTFFFHSDREYPRLGQMIVDYENPLKKMMEEFVPHGKVTFLTHRLVQVFFFFFKPF